MQAVVGGNIQTIYPYAEPVAIVCNEEGLWEGLPFNRSVEGGYGGLVGTFFVCGLSADSFCSLTSEQVKTYREKFQHAEILLGFEGGVPVTMKVPARNKNQPLEGKDRNIPPERG